MEITVSRDELAKALTFLKPYTSKPAVPVLSGVHVKIARGKLHLAAFDYGTAARATVAGFPGAKASGGKALVGGAVFAATVASLPKTKGTAVRLSADTQSGLKLECGPVETTLLYMPLDEYPELPPMPPVIGTADGASFASAAVRVGAFASGDDTLPVITMVKVETTTTGVWFAATDRYRLASDFITWKPARYDGRPADENDDYHLLIPGKQLVAFAKRFASQPIEIRFATPVFDEAGHGPTFIGLSAGGFSLTFHMTDAEYLNWRGRFPEQQHRLVTLHAAPFADAIRRAGAAADRSTGIEIRPGPDYLEVSGATQGHGGAGVVEKIPTISDEVEAISVNPIYLLSTVTGIIGDAVLRWPDPGKQVLMVTPADPDDQFRAIVVTLGGR